MKSFGLQATSKNPVFSPSGTAGAWWVGTLVTGMGPALAAEATRRALSVGSIDHVMVIGIAGGSTRHSPWARSWFPNGCSSIQMDPSSTPIRLHLGGLGRADDDRRLFDNDDVWRPILEGVRRHRHGGRRCRRGM